MSRLRELHPATQAVHGGEPRPRVCGALSMPIFQSAIYETTEVEKRRVGIDGSQIPAHERYSDLRYIRLNNTPNHEALQHKIATLENAEAALVTASGMAAISSTLLTVLSPGDHLLVQRPLYGGTLVFVERELARLGIECTWLDGNAPSTWPRTLPPRTRALYLETLSNPMVRFPAIREALELAQRHDLISVIDNTFATPYNFRPIEVGFDLCLHSGTKYMGGHTDLLAGVVSGRRDLVQSISERLADYGGSLNPLDCFLLQRSLKTLPLRMRQHNENALALAHFLEQHRAVRSVWYPGLESDPQHESASGYLRGFGGVLSFELAGGVDATIRMTDRLELATVAPSLGGVETTLTRPALTSHFNVPSAQRQAMGINDGLVRLSVGIEAAEDLISDFERALA